MIANVVVVVLNVNASVVAKNLQIDNPLDNHLKVIKDSDGTSSCIEISKDKLKILGEARGQVPTSPDGLATKQYVDDNAGAGGSTQISASNDTPASALTGDIKLHIEEDTGTLYFMNNDDTKIWSLDTNSYINLNFNITGFSDNLTSTFLIKAPGQAAGNISYDLTLNNPQSSTFTGTIDLTGKVNASQGGSFPLDFNQGNCTDNGDGSFTMSDYNEGSAISLLHPDADASDAWSSGIKTITSTVEVDDGTGNEELTTSIYFKNKKFYGYTTATDPTAGGFNVYDLQTNAYVTTSYTQSEVTIVTSAADNYVYYTYPSRISGTPTFKVNGFTTTFTSVSEDKVNQASNGYTEEYKIWKSPQFYNDATLTFEVT